MKKHRPFSKTEIKMLVYNKMRIKKMSYNDAYKEIAGEIQACIDNSKKEEEFNKKVAPDKFKESFKELTHGRKQ